MNFCITKHNADNKLIENDLKRFERTLQLYYFFNKNCEADEMQTLPYEAQLFEGNKDWWPPRLKASITDFCRKIKSKIQQATTRKIKHNLNMSEIRALQRLRNNKNIVIKKGDKSSGIVIMNKNDYETKIREMLNDINVYTKTNINDTEAVKLQADQIMHSLMRNGDITEKQCRHLTNINVRCPIFYGIPKIHKKDAPYVQ